MTRFYLVRHAEPDWSIAKTKGLRGLQLDLCPLTDTGIKQAEEIATRPELADAEIVVSSPYPRALQTAAILSRDLRLPLAVEHDLHEWIPALDQEYNWDELINTIMVEFKRSPDAAPSKEAPHNWESTASVAQRMRNVLKQYLSFNRVIVVTHGVAISCLLPDLRLGYGDMVELTMKSTLP